jgi:hypothetical protein
MGSIMYVVLDGSSGGQNRPHYPQRSEEATNYLKTLPIFAVLGHAEAWLGI